MSKNLLVNILVILAIFILASPGFVLIHFFHQQKHLLDHIQIKQGVSLQQFDFTHWQVKGEQSHKDYLFTGNVLSLQDKKFGPLQFSFIKEILIDHPQVVFYKDDQNSLQLTARQGFPKDMDFVNTDKIIFKGQAVLANTQGRVLMCDSLTWDKRADMFTGEGNCSLQMPEKSIHAPRILVDKNIMAGPMPEIAL